MKIINQKVYYLLIIFDAPFYGLYTNTNLKKLRMEGYQKIS